jgi:hypothetical protein
LGRPWATVLGAAVYLIGGGLAADNARQAATLQRVCDASLQTAFEGRSCSLQIERSGASLRLREPKSGREFVCQLCTDTEARDAAYRLGAAIVQAETNQPSASLELEAGLPAMELTLDGVSLSPGVDSIPLAPGRHFVEASCAQGTASVEVLARPGQRLVATASAAPPENGVLASRPRNYVHWSVAAMGTGLTLGAVGGFLLWRDGSCARPSDEQGFCPRYHETTAMGAVAVATGALLEVVALWWLWPRRAHKLVLAVEGRR